jgi:hypothetical protein
MTIDDVRHAIGRVSRGEPERNPIDYAQHWAAQAAEAELSRSRPEPRPTPLPVRAGSSFASQVERDADALARMREENAHLRRILSDIRGRPRTRSLIRNDQGQIVAVKDEE